MNGTIPHHRDTYPAIRLVARHHTRITWGLGALTVALCLFLGWHTGQGGWFAGLLPLTLGVVALVRLVTELVRLVADMLLPR